jgi:hypothetical protein
MHFVRKLSNAFCPKIIQSFESRNGSTPGRTVAAGGTARLFLVADDGGAAVVGDRLLQRLALLDGLQQRATVGGAPCGLLGGRTPAWARRWGWAGRRRWPRWRGWRWGHCDTSNVCLQ